MTILKKRVNQLIGKWDQFPIILIILLGIILRSFYLSGRGIWYDDAFSILLARRSILEIISGTAADTMPPVYYFLLHFWGFISQQIWFLRSLNVILSIITIYMVYVLMTSLGGKKAGLLAAFFTAISPFQIYHAQEIRMYVILELALITHIYFFVRLIFKPEPIQNKKYLMAGLILSGSIALCSHNLAIFTLIAIDIFLILQKEWKKLGWYILVKGVMGILFLPWLVFVPGQIEKIQTAFWTPRPGLVQIIQALITLFGTLPLDTIGTYISTIAIALLLVTLALKSTRAISKQPEIRLILCLIFIPPVLLFIASWLMRPVFVPRAFIVSGVMIYSYAGILLSDALQDQRGKTGDSKIDNASKAISIFGIGLLVLIPVISLPYQYAYNLFPRSEHRTLMEIVGKDCYTDCVIVHDNKLSYFPSIIYEDQPNQVFIADEAGSHNDTLALATQKAMEIFAKKDIQEAVDAAREIRFVVYSKGILEYKQAGINIHPKINWLNDHYEFVDHVVIGDLEIFDYIKPK